MAHEVKFSIPERELGNVQIEFRVRKGKHSKAAVIGTFKASKGKVVWRPGGSAKGHMLKWERLGSLMKTYGKEGKY